MNGYPTPASLRDSVQRYRDPGTSNTERSTICHWWAQLGIPNQFAALRRAAQMEQGDAR